jgi:hypothetical protein
MAVFDKIRMLTYLNTDKSEFYRPIARIFYEQHQKFVSYLSPQDVWKLLRQSEYSDDFRWMIAETQKQT